MTFKRFSHIVLSLGLPSFFFSSFLWMSSEFWWEYLEAYYWWWDWFYIRINSTHVLLIISELCKLWVPKPLLKIGSVNKAFLFCDWQRPKSYFQTFLFCKIKSWFFKYLFVKDLSWNLTKFQLNQKTDRNNENNNCVEILWSFTKLNFLTDAESVSFLSWKTKKFNPKKNMS